MGVESGARMRRGAGRATLRSVIDFAAIERHSDLGAVEGDIRASIKLVKIVVDRFKTCDVVLLREDRKVAEKRRVVGSLVEPLYKLDYWMRSKPEETANFVTTSLERGVPWADGSPGRRPLDV